MVPQLLQPAGDILVGLVLADVVDKESTDGATVVGGCDSTITFLAGGIPDLGLDGLCVDLDGSCSEFDTNGGLGIKVELVACESAEKVGFSDTRVSDQDNYSIRSTY